MSLMPQPQFESPEQQLLRRVREGGGRLIKEAMGADGGFAYAVIQDPVGATLALVPG